MEDNPNPELNDNNIDDNDGNELPDPTSSLALLLLKLQSRHNVNQVAIEEITSSYCSLLQETLLHKLFVTDYTWMMKFLMKSNQSYSRNNRANIYMYKLETAKIL